jgi:hypothetical protein
MITGQRGTGWVQRTRSRVKRVWRSSWHPWIRDQPVRTLTHDRPRTLGGPPSSPSRNNSLSRITRNRDRPSPHNVGAPERQRGMSRRTVTYRRPRVARCEPGGCAREADPSVGGQPRGLVARRSRNQGRCRSSASTGRAATASAVGPHSTIRSTTRRESISVFT